MPLLAILDLALLHLRLVTNYAFAYALLLSKASDACRLLSGSMLQAMSTRRSGETLTSS